ncbi:hypothetical protein [Mongoliimonas terrestris]|uniref:hypothetical protein n=1 Tax=Mongoliimonas terrestris TaxID=1709001 RepID=UPI0011151F8B|nr:hypothetical protein [Mongoliimonas terrestris]
MPTCSELAQYELYRSYVRHEDQLINFRLTWYMLGQTITLTALSYFLSNSYGLAQVSKLLDTWPALTLIFICQIGLVIAVLTWIGVMAADQSIKNLKANYEKTMLPLAGFPSITGGGGSGVAWRGAANHLWIPRIGAAFWVVVTVIAVWNAPMINSEVRRTVEQLKAAQIVLPNS